MSGMRKPVTDWVPGTARAGATGPSVEQAADRIAERLLDPATTDAAIPVTAHDHGGLPAARGGVPLPQEARDFFEPRLGQGLGDVRVHSDAAGAEAARAAGARAFVQGNSIYFDRGEYAPESSAGRALLAHELAHVAQVRAGEASPTALHRKPKKAVAPSPETIKARLILAMCMRLDTRAIIERIETDGVKIVLFDTAFDKWKYDNGGRIEENELKGLRGNTEIDEKTIRLRRSLSTEDMMMTLFHEMQHWGHYQDPAGPRDLESEIQARIASEQLAIERGKPETVKGYRTADGKVDEAKIRAAMAASPHYSPTGRERIGRRYVGETPIAGPWTCPPLGDFPENPATKNMG